MAGIVARRPVVGLMAGVIFAALGRLLISVEDTQPGIEGVLSGLYRVAGYFVMGVAFLSMLAGAIGIWSRRSRQVRAGSGVQGTGASQASEPGVEEK